jgi:hypothetical protein
MNSLFDQEVYIALHERNPDAGGAGELSGKSYKRFPAKALFSLVSEGQTELVSSVLFEDLPSAKISHAALWDSETGGNLLWASEFEKMREIEDGDGFKLPAGRFILGLT